MDGIEAQNICAIVEWNGGLIFVSIKNVFALLLMKLEQMSHVPLLGIYAEPFSTQVCRWII